MRETTKLNSISAINEFLTWKVKRKPSGKMYICSPRIIEFSGGKRENFWGLSKNRMKKSNFLKVNFVKPSRKTKPTNSSSVFKATAKTLRYSWKTASPSWNSKKSSNSSPKKPWKSSTTTSSNSKSSNSTVLTAKSITSVESSFKTVTCSMNTKI